MYVYVCVCVFKPERVNSEGEYVRRDPPTPTRGGYVPLRRLRMCCDPTPTRRGYVPLRRLRMCSTSAHLTPYSHPRGYVPYAGSA